MRIRPATAEDLPALARFATPLQVRPDRHVCYLSEEAEAIVGELAALPHWTEMALLAEDVEGAMRGWLVGETDDEIGRVWWLGPFVAGEPWAETADLLMAAGTERLAPTITQHELAVDSRFTTLIDWAVARGFVKGEASVAVATIAALAPVRGDPDIAPIGGSTAPATATLHDELFPGTHYLGRQLVALDDPTRILLVATGQPGTGEVTGYVAAEQQADGSGYIDYLAVARSARRRGLGSALIRAAGQELRRRGHERIHLTVREGNHAARAMYAGLGFVEERHLVPLRRGFTLD